MRKLFTVFCNTYFYIEEEGIFSQYLTEVDNKYINTVFIFVAIHILILGQGGVDALFYRKIEIKNFLLLNENLSTLFHPERIFHVKQ